MPSDITYNRHILEQAYVTAKASDPSTVEGCYALRDALMQVLCVNVSWLKRYGTRDAQVRALPPVRELTSIEGVSVNLADVTFYPEMRPDPGGANAQHLLREMGRAMVEGTVEWAYVGETSSLHLWRTYHLGTREQYGDDLAAYLERKGIEVTGEHATLLDATLTPRGLRSFILAVCESYLRCAE